MDIEEIAYGKGHNAYHNGYTKKDNPYKRFTKEWEQWREGWNDEKSDDPYWEKLKKYYRRKK